MNNKAIIAGVLIAALVVTGAAIALTHESKEPAEEKLDIAGTWYPAKTITYIDGEFFEVDLGDDTMFAEIWEVNISESENNVFLGSFMGSDIVGAYFDDGRVTFRYESTNFGTTFLGKIDGDFIYGGAVEYNLRDGERVIGYSTYVVLTKDPTNIPDVAIPDLTGTWTCYDAYNLSPEGSNDLAGGSFKVLEQRRGCIAGTVDMQSGDQTETREFCGFVSPTIDAKAFTGHIYVNGELWAITFRGDDVALNTSTYSEVLKDDPLVSVSRFYSKDGSATTYEVPNLKGKTFMSIDSHMATELSGVGKIVKSNTDYMFSFDEQRGTCLNGIIKIRGLTYPMTATIDIDGSIDICVDYTGIEGRWILHYYGMLRDDGGINLAISYKDGAPMGDTCLYNVMKPVSKNTNIADPEGLIGSWQLSSLIWDYGASQTIFDEIAYEMPLYITSVENNIAKGRFLDMEFTGTYSAGSLGTGSLWFTFYIDGGVIECEMFLRHNGTIVSTIAYILEIEDTMQCFYAQGVFTKIHQYSPIPNESLDLFDKEWECVKYEEYGSNGYVVREGADVKAYQLSFGRLTEKSDSMFAATIIVDGKTYNYTGSVVTADMHRNGLANVYTSDGGTLFMNYSDGNVWIYGLDYTAGSPYGFIYSFVEKGKQAIPFEGIDNIEGYKFASSQMHLEIDHQYGAFIVGTLRIGGEVAKFIGVPEASGNNYLSNISLEFANDTWGGYLTIELDNSGKPTGAIVEVVWVDENGVSSAVQRYAPVKK